MRLELKSRRIPEMAWKLDISPLLSELKNVAPHVGFGELESGADSARSHILEAIRQVLCELGFSSVQLLELTIFDPEDSSDCRFYTIVEAGTSKMLEFYQAEMDRNINKGGRPGNSELRGPIIPDQDLYHSAVWWSELPRSAEVMPAKKAIGADRFRTVGSFSVPSAHRSSLDDTNTSALLGEYIKSFAGNVARELVDNDGASEALRCFMLVPFSRPSPRRHVRLEKQKDIHRGGGLFVFGSLQKVEGLGIDEQILSVANVLTRILSDAVLRYSHTQLETIKAGSEGYQRALNAFAHQIRETAAGVGNNWLMHPSLWENAVAAYSQSGDFADRLTAYNIAPAPELFEGLRTTLSLWAQSRKWQDLFLREQKPPESLLRLIEIAFDYARDLRFVAAFRNANFQDWVVELPKVWAYASLEFLNKETHLRFKKAQGGTDLGDVVLSQPPSEEATESHSKFFRDLCESLRLFVAAFDNYMGRGDVGSPITITLVCDARLANLRLTLSNLRREDEVYTDSNIWPGVKGKDVIHDLAGRLGGDVVWPKIGSATKTFNLEIHLPLTPLWEIRYKSEGGRT